MSEAQETSANIASALTAMATRQPSATAIFFPLGRSGARQRYGEIGYQELDEDSTRIARGLGRLGLVPGTRAALMVKPSPELFALTFALFKAGVVPVMIDPGIGIKALGQCLDEAAPHAFIGIPQAHLARIALGWGRKSIRTNITVGRRSPWGGHTLEDVRNAGAIGETPLPQVTASDTAAILFTSGSTGIPKGAVYAHSTFAAQVALLRDAFGVTPGEVDLPTFPLFALFDPALGMTTVLPYMDATRPAEVDPREILEPIHSFGITNMFGSPALLRRVAFSKEARGEHLPSLRRVISAGAPVPATVIAELRKLLPESADVFTPYGATESLPVAIAEGRELLGKTRERTDRGDGVCVGRPVAGVRVEIIKIIDEPIERWSESLRVLPGEVGEIIVSGPNVTRAYFGREAATRGAKIHGDEGLYFHRMGDVGYFDDEGRLWYCGRKSHRVETQDGTLFTEQVEAIFNTHAGVARSALVGVKRDGKTAPVICIETDASVGRLGKMALRKQLLRFARSNDKTCTIDEVLFHPKFPVDIRHNAKIFREKLASWAEGELR